MRRKSRAWRPVPIIDPSLCDGCGLCVRACPTGALGVCQGVAAVSRPEACAYHGFCEMVCPKQAIQRPFEVIGTEG